MCENMYNIIIDVIANHSSVLQQIGYRNCRIVMKMTAIKKACMTQYWIK